MLLLAWGAGLPGGVLALVLLWRAHLAPGAHWTLTVVVLGGWLGCGLVLRARIMRPLQTLSNLLAGLREEDYSVRARGGREGDVLAEVHRELNGLVETLRAQRLGALEATALLRKVMAEIDVAVFAFDGAHLLRLVNRAGERLLAQPAERLLGRAAEELGLAECVRPSPPATIEKEFPGGKGRWGVHQGVFRQEGVVHHLLVLSDLSRALREEELHAWQRLVRVLGHELNNSLAPIRSLAATMSGVLSKDPKPSDWQEDMGRALNIISSRAEGLSRFMEAYTRVAALPAPRRGPVPVSQWVGRIVGLETRVGIAVAPGPALTLAADGDQLDQLLINLARNAVEAAQETGGGVRVGWRKAGNDVELWVEDDGPGLANTANLFVPFFTTKPKGTGIGLVLCRQIAERHGGSLTLANRPDQRGCVARVRLPLT